MPGVIRTLIVDDSAFVRKVVRQMLSGSPFIEVVGMARDGEEALALAGELKPDVVTCDLVMPRLGGVEYVRRQMATKPIPIVMLTSSPQDCEEVLLAMEAGAVDLVRKPTALASDELLGVRRELVDKVKAAGRIDLSPRLTQSVPGTGVVVPRRATAVDVLLIGVSTGGPQALRFLLPQFPPDFPIPIAIVLHMPVGYTAAFAKNLDDICQVHVLEARDGGTFEPGHAILGQAGRHLVLKRSASGQVVTHLATLPLDKPHRPSVDVLFQSAAETYGSRVLAVVLTGMGDDGCQGAACIKAKGGTILTESEESCVVYGMPREVVDAGLSDASYSLAGMIQGISERL